MSKITYNSTDAWAYGMLELISTFVARIDLDKPGLENLKELIPQRAVEAAIGQFIAAIEVANDL